MELFHFGYAEVIKMSGNGNKRITIEFLVSLFVTAFATTAMKTSAAYLDLVSSFGVEGDFAKYFLASGLGAVLGLITYFLLTRLSRY